MRRCGAGGFTLLEMMMVILIISILAAIGIPKWGDTVRVGQEKECAASRHSIETVEAHFVTDTGGGSDSVAVLYEGGRLDRLPVCKAGGTLVWSAPAGLGNDRYVVCSVHGP